MYKKPSCTGDRGQGDAPAAAVFAVQQELRVSASF